MLDEIPAELFAEWQAYFKLEPFGSSLHDLHYATLETILVNANRGKGQNPAKPKDFMLIKPSMRQTAQNLWENLKSWAYRSGAGRP